MLRALVVVLVAANIVFFGYTRGWFDGVLGLSSLGDREPQRLAAQVRPETVRLLGAGAGASAASTASAPASSVASTAAATACFEAGPFGAAEASSVEAQLAAALPAGTWSTVKADAPSGSRLYRVAAASPTLAAQLASLKLGAAARGFSPCPNAPPR